MQIRAHLEQRVADLEARCARLEVMLTQMLPKQPQPCDPELLTPSELAFELSISEQHVRKLCKRGYKLGVADVERNGGRWLATEEAIQGLRREAGAFGAFHRLSTSEGLAEG